MGLALNRGRVHQVGVLALGHVLGEVGLDRQAGAVVQQTAFTRVGQFAVRVLPAEQVQRFCSEKAFFMLILH